jgi:hypothetical protein
MSFQSAGSYCYALLDTRKPGSFQYVIDGIPVDFDFEPFYVGKGRGARDIKHFCPSNYARKTHPKNAKIAKIIASGLRPKAVRFFEDLSDVDALAREIKAIAAIGRKDTGIGPLTNLSDGGEGASGTRWSEEAKKRYSEKKKGIPLSESARAAVVSAAAKRRGEKRPEVGKKISEALKGKPKSAEHAAQMIARNKARIGIKATPEMRARLSAAQKARWAAINAAKEGI